MMKQLVDGELIIIASVKVLKLSLLIDEPECWQCIYPELPG
jgi:hypothetical protein